MNGVLTSGNIVLDILVRPVDSVEWGVTRWVDSLETSLGGNGANTACALAKLGVPSRLLGMLGPDTFGETCRQRLIDCRVDTSALVNGLSPTATSIVLVKSTGERTFLHRPGVSRDVFADGLHFGDISGFSHYHLANIFSLTHLRPIAPQVLAHARALGLGTSLDTASDAMGLWMETLAPCLPWLDILFVNEDEAEKLSGSRDPSANADFFLTRGVRTFVMKLGPKGCAVYTPTIACHVPGFPVQAVDTTGAGDCFAGAFLASRQRGLSWEHSARVANAVGALIVEQVGATTGLRSWDETLTRFDLPAFVEESRP
jgi:sugar/nucleoside kinase (ribokinase family)